MSSNRKPRALKIVSGTLRPSRDRAEIELETIGVAGLAEPPDWLAEPGRTEYLRAGAILAGAGVLTVGDEAVLLTYAASWAGLVRMWENDLQPNAADLTAFRLLANDLGLSPRARASLPSPGARPVGNKFANNGRRKS